MVLDASLLNTQHYKKRIKGKVEQSSERSSILDLHLGVVAIKKGAFQSPTLLLLLYLKLFNAVKINDYDWIKLLLLDSKTWND